jgi:hypothetical protein
MRKGWRAVGEVLDERGHLGEHRAVVQAQRRDVALGIHREVVLSRCRAPGAQVDLLELEGNARLAGDDVGRRGAGPGKVVELHGFSARGRCVTFVVFTCKITGYRRHRQRPQM